MPILIYISWACYAAAALCLTAILSTESLIYLTPAISAAVAGVVFAALERIIDTLTDIRDAVCTLGKDDVAAAKMADNKTASTLPPADKDSTDLANLEKKIARLRKT